MANQLIIPLLLSTKEVDFLPLDGSKRSAYQQALARVSDTNLFLPPIIITKKDLRTASRKQAEDMDIAASVLVEPPVWAGIIAGAAIARTQSAGAIVVTMGMWSITDPVFSTPKKAFLTACRVGRMAAEDGRIVTFGILPTEARPSYTYIRRGIALDFDGVHAVAARAEKPDKTTAEGYVTDGYLWDTGSLMFRVDILLAEVGRITPDISRAIESAVAHATRDAGFVQLDDSSFASVRTDRYDPIDRVLTRTDRFSVVEIKRSSPKLEQGTKTESPKLPSRTTIGRAVLRNGAEIALSIEPLLVLIDQKIAALRERLPNSPEKQAERDEEIAQYEAIKAHLKAFQAASLKFGLGKVDEKEVVATTKLFADGVLAWWKKNSDGICTSAFNTGLRTIEGAVFVGCVSVCSLAGVGSPLVTALTGALIGGKPIIDALKSLQKLFKNP